MAHTPGPLSFRADGDANRYAILRPDGNWLMTLLHNGEEHTAEQIDNMQLFTAAPDLLAALTKAVDFIENVTDEDPERTNKFFACREAWRTAFWKAQPENAPAGWTHAETSAPDDPTQQPASLRFVKSLAGQSLYQMLDASGSLVAMLTVMVPADGPAVATRLNQALAAHC